MTGFLAICMLTAGYAMIAKRLETTILTAPMVFLGAGAVLSVTGMVDHATSERLLHPLAEITLVVLLFLDAAQVDLRALRQRHVWPLRMLLIGLPLTIVFGSLAGFLLLSGWTPVAVILAAAILAPTDAALGQAVVSNPKLPVRLRRALTVESGLNDGLALPAVLFFAGLTAATMQSSGAWVLFAAKQITLGPLAGAAIGAAGGWILLRAKKYSTTADIYEGVGALAMAGAAYLSATLIGGNGFIAAFVAGLFFGAMIKGACKFVYEFTESEGQLLVWASFLLLGIALVPEAVAHLTWPMFGLILVSLFIVRPLAIWLSLAGTDAPFLTRLFFGWFGPRGLATALFALLVIDEVPHALGETILHLAVNTVWISALLHGITAAPLSNWYAGRIAVSDAPSSEVDRNAAPLPGDKA
ncbi:cation:proton antiporter [Yoonia sp. SS1-5]|uniref:Cation:proton antiporter n=1 Tax=Yoonia rhodophyticola TaxID=3137370 RepID=A0AAN0M7L6_9RHOB